MSSLTLLIYKTTAKPAGFDHEDWTRNTGNRNDVEDSKGGPKFIYISKRIAFNKLPFNVFNQFLKAAVFPDPKYSDT